MKNTKLVAILGSLSLEEQHSLTTFLQTSVWTPNSRLSQLLGVVLKSLQNPDPDQLEEADLPEGVSGSKIR